MLVGIDGRAANTATPLGAGVYCYELLRALGDLDVDLRIYLDRDPAPNFPLSTEEAEIRVLPNARFWTLRRLSRELRRDTPDLFFAPVLQTPLGCPCPVVVTHHGIYREQAHCLTARDRRGLARATQMAKWFARHFIVVSEDSREQLAALCGIPKQHISVTYHACSRAFTSTPDPLAAAAVRSKFDLPKRFVLFTGRLSPRKNLVRMIEAYGRVLAEDPDLPQDFVIAGARDAKTASTDLVMEAARSIPNPERIRFIGHVERDDMPALMREAEALLFVSICESFGIPAVEAMASGTPLLTARNCAMPEVTGGAALLADPFDVADIAAHLEVLLKNDGLRADLAERGLARARDFTWAKTAAKTLEIFEAVLG